jgi:hypothetical protein
VSKPTRRDVANALAVREADVPLADDRVQAAVVTGEQVRLGCACMRV